MSERIPLNTRLGDGLGDSADDRRNGEDAQEVVDGHEDALQFSDRVIHLANGQKQHRRPVDAEEVVVGHACARSGTVDPVVGTKSDPRAELVVEASVPVDGQHDHDAEDADSQDVGVLGAGLSTTHELHETT